MKRFALCTFGMVLLSTPALLAQELPGHTNRIDFDPFQDAMTDQPQPAAASSSARVTRQELVFRKAALRAAQRQERIALNKFLGYSPLRPPASSVPAMGSPIGRPVVVWRYPGTLYPLRPAGY